MSERLRISVDLILLHDRISNFSSWRTSVLDLVLVEMEAHTRTCLMAKACFLWKGAMQIRLELCQWIALCLDWRIRLCIIGSTRLSRSLQASLCGWDRQIDQCSKCTHRYMIWYDLIWYLHCVSIHALSFCNVAISSSLMGKSTQIICKCTIFLSKLSENQGVHVPQISTSIRS